VLKPTFFREEKGRLFPFPVLLDSHPLGYESFFMENSTMSGPREVKRRGQPRLETTIPIHFNLSPDYHCVPTIRKLGVGGTVCNISLEGFQIEAEMDRLDVCQIFPEEMEDDSPFELEVVFRDSRGKRLLIRGSVRWYELSEQENDIRHFKAGLYLKDTESRAMLKKVKLGG
jgi:hypothetical protein